MINFAKMTSHGLSGRMLLKHESNETIIPLLAGNIDENNFYQRGLVLIHMLGSLQPGGLLNECLLKPSCTLWVVDDPVIDDHHHSDVHHTIFMSLYVSTLNL